MSKKTASVYGVEFQTLEAKAAKLIYSTTINGQNVEIQICLLNEEWMIEPPVKVGGFVYNNLVDAVKNLPLNPSIIKIAEYCEKHNNKFEELCNKASVIIKSFYKTI